MEAWTSALWAARMVARVWQWLSWLALLVVVLLALRRLAHIVFWNEMVGPRRRRPVRPPEAAAGMRASHARDQLLSVVVTGCDSGFGAAVCRRLHAKGYRVFAGCFLPATVHQLHMELGTDRMRAFQLDVADPESVKRAVATVRAVTPRLWAVINNAGIAEGANIEWTPLPVFERVMNVNAFGTVRVAKAFLPLLLNEPEPEARIINVASVLGYVALPGSAAYAMSKHAVEAFSEALRVELRPWGVKVITLEPGFFRTTMPSRGLSAAAKMFQSLPQKEREERWGEEFWSATLQHSHRMVDKASGNPKTVVDAMVHAVEARYPNAKYQLGLDARAGFNLLWGLPTFVRDIIMGRLASFPANAPPAGLAARQRMLARGS